MKHKLCQQNHVHNNCLLCHLLFSQNKVIKIARFEDIHFLYNAFTQNKVITIARFEFINFHYDSFSNKTHASLHQTFSMSERKTNGKFGRCMYENPSTNVGSSN